MAGRIHLPHPDMVALWKEEKVIKWLRRVHLDDCIPAFEIRHIDGSKLLELTEQKLFTYQDLKIKHRKQIAKCVQECKSQATNAKRIARTIKQKNRIHPDGVDTNGDYDSEDDWGSDFEDESEDEVKSEHLVAELNNNNIIHPICNSVEENLNLNSRQEKPQQEKFIPQPPDVPVISKTNNGTLGCKGSPSRCNTIPRPPIKRPPSQPPPPPVQLVSSDDIEQEDYEIPIASTASNVKEELSDTSFHSAVSNDFAAETYELIEPPEETYEMVDAPSPSCNVEKPVLPPRLPISCSITSPPPLPQKPKKLKDSLIHERSEGIRTFSRPKPAAKADPETEPSQSLSTVNVGFIGTLIGRRPSNTSSLSPKTEHKGNNDYHDGPLSSSHSVVSSTDGFSSRSSSPDKDGSSDSKKSTPLPPLPSRGAASVSDETAQNMATRPLPPVPVPQEKKVVSNTLVNIKTEDLTKYPWFHEIERQTAEEVVKDLNESGSFVVRPSKRAGIDNPYSLTIFHDDKLFHLNIRIRPDNTFALGKEKKIEKTFSTVADLISFHQTDPILLTSRGEPAGKTILCKYPQKAQL